MELAIIMFFGVNCSHARFISLFLIFRRKDKEIEQLFSDF